MDAHRDQDGVDESPETTLALEAAFRAGDFNVVVDVVGDPRTAVHGPMPRAIGNPLVYSIYASPVGLIRELLDRGADPNVEVDDGFPPLIAALTTAYKEPGQPVRDDVDDIVRLLLSHGVDPNQRGINDYTALHLAASTGQHLAVRRLMEAGADHTLRTRIDDLESPAEAAPGAGYEAIARTLESAGTGSEHRLRSGIVIEWDVPGDGEKVRRQRSYVVRMRCWLPDGTPVIWPERMQWADHTVLHDDGALMQTQVQINRGQTMSGIFYGVDGMRVGGTRRLRVTPYHAFGDGGYGDLIPPKSSLTIELTVVGTLAPPVRDV